VTGGHRFPPRPFGPALHRGAECGQGLIEFAMILPLFAVLLLGVLELGTAFSHHLSLEYATREGARSGSALANGGGALGCSAGQSPKAATVDPLIIEAVQRVLTSPGSPIKLSSVTQIRIYKANATGGESGPVNIWTYAPGAGPTPVDSADPLDFKQSGATGWTACSRSNANPAEMVGVSITYTYQFTTGLTQLLSFIGVTTGPTWTLGDRTVMNLNPTAL
jgi:TadE-like protein